MAGHHSMKLLLLLQAMVILKENGLVFSHRERILMREAELVGQGQDSLLCEEKWSREGKTTRRDGVGNDGERERKNEGLR